MNKMRKALEVGLIVLVCSLSTQIAHGDVLQLASDGASEYRVVIAENAEQPIPAAAQEFVDFFEEITGARLPIISDAEPMGEREIIIGPSKHLDNLATYIDWEKLGREGYVIRTVGNYLLLFGGPERGTINAVYTFLDEYLGCRWYTSTFSVIPNNPDLSIDLIHVEKVPAFESRSFMFNSDTPATPEDMVWAARMRLSTFSDSHVSWSSFDKARELLSDPRLAKVWIFAATKKGTGQKAGRPITVHTLGGYLLPNKYFKEHPEYFGMLRDGNRDPNINPCLTNPEVLRIVVENARKWLEQTPGANIISVSQPDVHDYCHCPRCQEAGQMFTYKLTKNPLGVFLYGKLPDWNRDEGRKLVRPTWDPVGTVGPLGVLLEFVNRVAEELEADYPDVLVHTFAYYWSRWPPEEIKLHPNVVIEFAPWSSCNYHPLADCAHDEAFLGLWTAVRRWREKTPHIWLWRYDIVGGDLKPHPRPTLTYLDLQMREFEMAGIGGVFFHIHGFVPYSFMRDLYSYLYAKLLWEPGWNMWKGMEEFIRAYYGDAAEEILAYVLQTQESNNYDPTVYPVATTGPHGKGEYCYPGQFHSYSQAAVRPAAVRKWDKLFDAAEAKVTDDAACLERVQVARLAMQRCALEYLPKDDPVRVKAYRDIFLIAGKAGMSPEQIREKYGPKE